MEYRCLATGQAILTVPGNVTVVLKRQKSNFFGTVPDPYIGQSVAQHGWHTHTHTHTDTHTHTQMHTHTQTHTHTHIYI